MIEDREGRLFLRPDVFINAGECVDGVKIKF